VESGRAAGVYTIGVTWGAFTAEAMARSGADLVIHEIGELPSIVKGTAVRG
jgi:phosphoglycolate phosphatase-like HAD superfamily hydrolase